MMSETDHPFEAFCWEGATSTSPDKILQVTNNQQETSIEVVDVDYFFRNIAEPKDWHSEQQQAEVGKYQKLVEVIKDNLKDPKVYRIGEISIDAYIIGTTNEGTLAGLATKLVET
jgi:hypothetical protein